MDIETVDTDSERNEPMSTTTIDRAPTRRPLLIALVLMGILLAAGLWLQGVWRGGYAQVVSEPVNQPLGAATRAEVEIAMGVGQLRIGALEEPTALVAGEIAYPDHNRVERAFSVRGDTATFSLREHDSQATSLIKYSYDAAIWDLRLAPATPMRLTLETAVGEGTIDLGQLRVTDLTLKAGVGQTMLTLPREGQVRADVSGGVGETTIRIPADLAVRLALDTGVGTVHVPAAYQKQGNIYVSEGYETAANRVDLTVSSGIGDVVIVQDGD
jgi:hypothetical protein